MTTPYNIRNLWPESADQTAFIQEAGRLTTDGYYELIDIYLPKMGEDYHLYLTKQGDVEWAGKHWEGTGVEITGIQTSSMGEYSRPTLRAVNPNNLFSLFVAQGKLLNGTVTRHRVLPQHIQSNTEVSLRQLWRIGQVLSMNRDTINLELKNFTDRFNFKLPARQFFPPDFTHVKLG